jgi:universal stress protein F
MLKDLIVPIDLSDKYSIQAVLPITLNFVSMFNAKLHLVYIIPDFGMKLIEDYLPKHWNQDQKAKYLEQMQEIIDQYIPDTIDVTKHVGRGAIYDEVISYANNINADLIIVSAVNPRLRDYMLGSNASKIVRHANCSVMVIRDSD